MVRRLTGVYLLRLVDADALVDVLGDPKLMLTLMLGQKAAERNDEWGGVLLRRMDVLRCVLKAPIIDAEPVAHARWDETMGFRMVSGCVLLAISALKPHPRLGRISISLTVVR